MLIALFAGLAGALLVGLINAEKTELPARILAFKTPLSLLFILAWFLQPAQHAGFAGLILIGLICCLGRDILLALGTRLVR